MGRQAANNMQFFGEAGDCSLVAPRFFVRTPSPTSPRHNTTSKGAGRGGSSPEFGHAPFREPPGFFGMPHGSRPDLPCPARSPQRANFRSFLGVCLRCTSAPIRCRADVDDLGVPRGTRTPPRRRGVRCFGVAGRTSVRRGAVEEDEACGRVWKG